MPTLRLQQIAQLGLRLIQFVGCNIHLFTQRLRESSLLLQLTIHLSTLVFHLLCDFGYLFDVLVLLLHQPVRCLIMDCALVHRVRITKYYITQLS